MNLESIKDKIRKLLNVAGNHAATPGEVENAIRAARNLMLKHHIDEEDCKGNSRDQIVDVYVETNGARMSIWENILGALVGQFVGGVVVSRYGPRKAMFSGYAADVQLAADIYAMLLSDIAKNAKLLFGGYARGPGLSYCLGFIAGLRTHKEKEDASPETAGLIVRSQEISARKEREVIEWFESQGHRVKHSSVRPAITDPDAYDSGYQDGKRQGFKRGQEKIA